MRAKDAYRDIRIVIGWHGLSDLTEIEVQQLNGAVDRLSGLGGDQVAAIIAQHGRGQAGAPLSMPRERGSIMARRAGEEREGRRQKDPLGLKASFDKARGK